jgi:hypothetical protein
MATISAPADGVTRVQGHGKLGLKFYGPFKLEECIGEVVYKLKLSASVKTHNVFHMVLLKKFTGAPPLQPSTLPLTCYSQVCLESEEATKYRVAQGCHELLSGLGGIQTVVPAIPCNSSRMS